MTFGGTDKKGKGICAPRADGGREANANRDKSRFAQGRW